MVQVSQQPNFKASSLAAGVVTFLLSGPALALTQPDGAQIPSPMGCSGNEPTGLEAVMACACTTPGICNVGASCPGGSTACANGQNGTCEATLWHSPNDNSCIPSNQSGMNVATAASINPETFHPTCGQTFTVISRGTAMFQDVFGWYNATSGGVAPDPSDLHVLITCTDAAGAAVPLNVTADPGYKGGEIGFFLISPEDHTQHGSCASSDCCPSVARFQAGQGYVYYSQLELSPDYSSSAPYIHLLNLASTIELHRYYFAWEDTFDTTSADFTDLVVAVDGVECSGAGVSCSTGKKGACAFGVTECVSGSTTPTCQELVQPKPEVCNGVDDNCDGIVDNGATCPDGNVCVNGACVANCRSAESFCGGGYVCDDDVCVTPACMGVSCAASEVCQDGKCVAACAGVVCPFGQTCLDDVCKDLCAGVACPTGQVCAEGVCFAGCTACGGVSCTAPLACDATSGTCMDMSCAAPCAAGTHCSAGACVDDCQGAVCPEGAACSTGMCGSADAGVDSGSGKLAMAGLPPDAGAHPDATSSADGGGTADGGGSAFAGTPRGGCGCSAPGVRIRARGFGERLLLAGFGGVIVARRRRRRRV